MAWKPEYKMFQNPKTCKWTIFRFAEGMVRPKIIAGHLEKEEAKKKLRQVL